MSRNPHDVLVISLWILLFIKHMQHYEMMIIMQVIYIYSIIYVYDIE